MTSPTTCLKGTDWDVTDPTDYTKGLVICSYNYDYSNFHDKKYSDFGGWIKDIYNGINPSAPNGIDPAMKMRIRDSNIVYALLLDLYNQMYNTGYYAGTVDTDNPFYSYRLDSNFSDEYVEEKYIDVMSQFVNPAYPDSPGGFMPVD